MSLDLEQAKKWCAEARQLLAAPPSRGRKAPKGLSIGRAREKADEMLNLILDEDGRPIDGARPEGADEAEWQAVLANAAKVKEIKESKHQQKKGGGVLKGGDKDTFVGFIAAVDKMTANAFNNQIARHIRAAEVKTGLSPDPDGTEWAEFREALERMKGEVSDKLEKGRRGKEGGLAQSDVAAAASLAGQADGVIERIKARLQGEKEGLLAEIEGKKLAAVPEGTLPDHAEKLRELMGAIETRLNQTEPLTSRLVQESNGFKEKLEMLHKEIAARKERQEALRGQLSRGDAASLEALEGDAKVEFAVLLKADPKNAKLALTETTRLREDWEKILSAFAGLGDFAPRAEEMEKRQRDFDKAIRGLKLEEADTLVGELKQTLHEGGVVKSEVEVLQADYRKDGKKLPEGVEDLRKLSRIEQRFKEFREIWPGRLKERKAEAESQATAQKANLATFPLMQRCEQLEKNVGEMLVSWPGRDLTFKLTDSGNGSVSYLFEKLAQLDSDTELGPEEQRARREKKEWDAFCADVEHHWRAYVVSGYNRNLRGPFSAKKSTLFTDYIRAQCRADKTFNIAGRQFTVSSSDSAGISLKTPVNPPPPHDFNAMGQRIQSFIYHL